MLNRDDWFHLARKIDWKYSYVSAEEMFPQAISVEPLGFPPSLGKLG